MLPGILPEVAERPAALHRPAIGRHLAGEDPERARLAGAVAADDAHLVAARDGEVEVAHDGRAAGLDGEAADLEGVHADGSWAIGVSRVVGGTGIGFLLEGLGAAMGAGRDVTGPPSVGPIRSRRSR